jgi:hypothetical protein
LSFQQKKEEARLGGVIPKDGVGAAFAEEDSEEEQEVEILVEGRRL